MTIYAETSAVRRWLFAETGGEAPWQGAYVHSPVDHRDPPLRAVLDECRAPREGG